ncbi:MAG: hypothetical protein IPP14_15685 [Planctomycetes bacterium]|nr:hypothetical protein [Planctomycetota bacterium]
MSEKDATILPAASKISRQYVQRLARLGAVVPAMQEIYESTVDSGDFNTFGPLGMVAPNAAPGAATGAAGALTGAYAYYVTPYDNNRGLEGDESAQSSTVNPAAERVTVDLTTITNEIDNPRATHWRIYRNLNGGSVYFFVAQVTVATSSYSDNNTDASISANDTLQLDNTPPSQNTYGLCLAHKGFMFYAGPYNPLGGTEYDDDFTWSKLYNPGAVPSVNRSKAERGLYGPIRAMASVGDLLVFFKQEAFIELHFQTDPSGVTGDGFAKTMNTQRGCVNGKCVANDQGTLYVMDRKGIYAYRGGQQVIELALPLMGLWKRINWAQREKFSACVSDNAIYFSVALDGESECKYILVLNKLAIYAERGPRWYLHKVDHGIRDMVEFNTTNETAATEFGFEFSPFAAFITEYGYTGVLGVGYRDMVDPQLTATGTVTSATTTTLTDSGATFTRTNEASVTVDVNGCYVRFLVEPSADRPTSTDWSQPYRITTVNSATQITVTPAMPSTPPNGTVFVIGAIPDALLHSPVMGFGMPFMGKRAGKVQLEYQPLGVDTNFGVGVKLDRRGIEGVDQTTSESNYSSTSGGRFKNVAVGGSMSTSGGLGVTNASVAARGFRLMQLVFDGTGVDKPVVIDSIAIELSEVGEGGGNG